MPTKEIELKDIGRPKSLRIPIPEDGGIVVLTGPNGAGKSTTLDAIQEAVTDPDKKRSKPRDGVATGSLTGCGITMRVGRKITRSGELQVETLDGGRLSIADLVSPPFKGAEEADGRRIKALVQLAGVEADPMLFAGLLPNFRDVVDVNDLDDSDILKMADQIKRKIESEARNAEGRRDIEKQRALSCEEAAAGIPFDVEADAGKLQLALEDAVRQGQELISKAREAKARNADIAETRRKIEEATAEKDAPSLYDLKTSADQAFAAVQSGEKTISRLRQELRDFEAELILRRQRHDSIDRELAAAELFHSTLAAWQKTVTAGEMTGPTDEDLAAADEAITAAREAIEAGSAARAAKAKLATAETHRKAEIVAEQQAETFRTAAASVDQVLTDQIATLGCPLRVEAGRLLTDTDRGPTFYAELSDGERWKMAVEIAVKAVGKGGLLVIPQAAYGEIQPRVRRELHESAKGAGVVILTALATDDDEIQAEQFEEMESVATP